MVLKDGRVWKCHLGHSLFYSLENCGLERGPDLSEAAELVRAEQDQDLVQSTLHNKSQK